MVIFDQRLIDVVEKYVKKGSKLYIEGQLQTRKWTDQQGVEKYSTEVVLQRFRGELTMLDTRASGGGGYDAGQGSGQGGDPGYGEPAMAGSGGGQRGGSSDLDDEIPF